MNDGAVPGATKNGVFVLVFVGPCCVAIGDISHGLVVAGVSFFENGFEVVGVYLIEGKGCAAKNHET